MTANHGPDGPEIYLDMDGVCVDFMSAVIAANGLEPAAVLAAWGRSHRGSVYPHDVIGMPPDQFFRHNALDEADFWATLPAYAWFDSMFERLSDVGHVVFLTAPTGSPGCVAGKLAWLNERFGSDFRDFIFTTHKSRLAHPGAYLIDDLDRNINDFERRSGNGILFPRIWNSNEHVEANPADFVVDQLTSPR